ncbi:MAG: alpha-glucosidase C-terminal domain-containing protein [Armatimonadetes bacterium]|nr:alpha-glucosidase C-terminal domain-containing protein [Armatimonadota bacterium]
MNTLSTRLMLSIAALTLPVVPFLAPRVALAQTAPADTMPHTFMFAAPPQAKTVNVAGTFNNWDKNALPMTKGADGVWVVQTRVPLGKSQYKFVINGETWVTDPEGKSEDDGGGNNNSVLLKAPKEYATPARVGDGVITASAVLHDTAPPFRNYDRGQLSLSVRVRPNDVKSVAALVGGKRYPLVRQGGDELYDKYAVRVPWNRKTDLSYSFAISDGAKTFRYGANGLTASAKPFTLDAATFKPYVVPGWVEKTVFYQIFPDRFENGDKTNDPKDVQSWSAKPEWFNRFGGDIAGVEKRVGYLDGLGVGAVYFNPVFASPSNHRYDAEDFKRIDGQFGTNAEFARLTKELEKRGIKTVMDFVFNHSATTFFAFQDIRDKGEASAYKDWYFIKSYPVKIGENPNYAAWYGFSSMPKLNVLNPPTHDYLLSLMDYWTKTVPLAGIRLDVANEVEQQFWRDLRVRAKGIDPNLWIVGEVWGDGSPWLKGDQWDSVMNYRFRDACLGFFAEEKTTPTQFANRLVALEQSYAPQVSRNMMNLLSSHDTPRFLTSCKNNEPMHQLAATLQFTWVGAPSIYYGEEIGMQGGGDPDNRRGMDWDKATESNAMLAHYKKLIAVRNAHPALQSGDAKILSTDDKSGTLAFSRTSGKDVAVVVLNRSRETRTVNVPAPKGTGTWKDALSGKSVAPGANGTVSVTLAPLTGAVLTR